MGGTQPHSYLVVVVVAKCLIKTLLNQKQKDSLPTSNNEPRSLQSEATDFIFKLIMPDVKKFVYMVVQAWARVSEDKVVIFTSSNDVIDKEINQFMRIETSDVLKDLDYKLKLLNLKKFS